MHPGETIVAIATAAGAGGIGVIRLSGDESLRLAAELLTDKDRLSLEKITPRTALFRTFVHPDTGATLDNGLLLYFPAPNSYTGEDCVEIHSHGSMPVLRHLVACLVSRGAAPADPGEFTWRAVLNDKMDISRAEAVNRLIRSETLVQAQRAVRQMEGSISRLVERTENRLLDLIARMEAVVDFADEDETFIAREHAGSEMQAVEKELAAVVSAFAVADRLREGAEVVIAGRTNAGKSTLFNAILRQERAIVDSQPGTTRDYIAERIEIGGLPVTLIDTAGIRLTGERIEAEGIRRSHVQVERADLVLLVTVAGERLHEAEKRIIEQRRRSERPLLHLRNKSDIADGYKADREDPVKSLPVSALTGEGIEELQGRIRESLGLHRLESEKHLVTEHRQQQLFVKTLEALRRAITHYDEQMPDEVVLEELRIAMNALDEITGRGGTEELLRRIFSSFCIGK